MGYTCMAQTRERLNGNRGLCGRWFKSGKDVGSKVDWDSEGVGGEHVGPLGEVVGWGDDPEAFVGMMNDEHGMVECWGNSPGSAQELD